MFSTIINFFSDSCTRNFFPRRQREANAALNSVRKHLLKFHPDYEFERRVPNKRVDNIGWTIFCGDPTVMGVVLYALKHGLEKEARILWHKTNLNYVIMRLTGQQDLVTTDVDEDSLDCLGTMIGEEEARKIVAKYSQFNLPRTKARLRADKLRSTLSMSEAAKGDKRQRI